MSAARQDNRDNGTDITKMNNTKGGVDYENLCSWGRGEEGCRRRVLYFHYFTKFSNYRCAGDSPVETLFSCRKINLKGKCLAGLHPDISARLTGTEWRQLILHVDIHLCCQQFVLIIPEDYSPTVTRRRRELRKNVSQRSGCFGQPSQWN